MHWLIATIHAFPTEIRHVKHGLRNVACATTTIKPKVMIINAVSAHLGETSPASWTRVERDVPRLTNSLQFGPEASAWYSNFTTSGLGDLFARNITVPGLSPVYPMVHCTLSGDVCQVTVGESEINAAGTMGALIYASAAPNTTTGTQPRLLDLTTTYFLGAGIAGVNPKLGTLGGVALARHVVQVALQYELDAREMPAGFASGYFAFDTDRPAAYPGTLYGTEVARLNTALGDAAAAFASAAELRDSPGAAAYRKRYGALPAVSASGGVGAGAYAAALGPPTVVRCDFATSDVYYSGALLSEAFENTTMAWTNQTNVTYCMTAQEDAAVLHVLLRAHLAGLVDFSRAIMLRTGRLKSRFSQTPHSLPSRSCFPHLEFASRS
jgi:purine nucleoside permease